MYFEKQVARHCLVHAWNNMHGGKRLDHNTVLTSMNNMFELAVTAKVMEPNIVRNVQTNTYCKYTGNYLLSACL